MGVAGELWHDPELRGYVGLALIVGASLSTAVYGIVHALETDFGPLEAVYIFTPIVVSTALVVGGVWLWAYRFEGPEMLRVGAWVFVGMTVFALLVTWTITHEIIRGETFYHRLFVTVNSVSVGGFVGLILGWFDARNRLYERRLEREQEELRKQIEQLDEFASIVAHDLRTPLTVASGRLELARQDCDSEHLDTAETALGRMETLIENLLVLAREGQPIDDFEPIELSTVVGQCWGSIDTADATVTVERDGTFVADADRLWHLFANLFRNAIEHGSETVTIRVGMLPDETGFYVEDDGPGIPDAERERIFETGYSTSEAGTGFGLRIVERIADAHGWEITVGESEDGGARFDITGLETPDST